MAGASRTLVLRPSAKINLMLRVGPVRADGFHDVSTLLQSIDLHDTLTLVARPGPFVLQCRSRSAPADRTNLVWRAASLLWTRAGRDGEARNVRAVLKKAIPSGAGLGGGSADAAAALVGLNRLWRTRLDRQALVALAAELGSDVPFFLFGGTALAGGRGEELYPVDDISRFGVVLLQPPFGVATADAYRWLDQDRARDAGPVTLAMTSHQELHVGWPTGPITLANDLEPPVARRHPVIGAMIAACRREGAAASAMTGSGSVVFGLFSSPISPALLKRLKRPGWRVLATRTLDRRSAGRRRGV